MDWKVDGFITDCKLLPPFPLAIVYTCVLNGIEQILQSYVDGHSNRAYPSHPSILSNVS